MFDLKLANYWDTDGVFIRYLNYNEHPEITLVVGVDKLVFKTVLTKSDEDEYRNGLIKCYKDNLTSEEIRDFKIDYTLKFIDGLDGLNFSLDGRPISSTTGNKNYNENWREVFREYASDLVLEICTYLLDESCHLVNEFDFKNEIKNLEKLRALVKKATNNSKGNVKEKKLSTIKSKVKNIFN